jgi:hypothetical protein
VDDFDVIENAFAAMRSSLFSMLDEPLMRFSRFGAD